MTDIHIKTPDTRNRWWTIPKNTKEYKDGWNRIFDKANTADREEAPDGQARRNEYYKLVRERLELDDLRD
mgnify:CR=1 FL=1